jgi:hypothetical protein
MTDHELAAYLRKYNALHDWKHEGNNCAWYDAKGDIVASVQYDSAKCIKLSVLTFKPL